MEDVRLSRATRAHLPELLALLAAVDLPAEGVGTAMLLATVVGSGIMGERLARTV